MDYDKQIAAFVNYFQRGEKARSGFKIGVELEHLVLHKKNMRHVSYYGERGIEALLHELARRGWEQVYEGDHLVQLQNDDAKLTLEPGAQVELSINPQRDLDRIEEIYLAFLHNAVPILEDWGMQLVSVGYQPVSSITEIPLLPKARYRYMYDYFRARGDLAHHMMKGTASTQVSIDYSSERDFTRKLRVTNYLAPLIYYAFDNSPFFEGRTCPGRSVRQMIWYNCDSERCGCLTGVLCDSFSYRSYAEHLLNVPPIIVLERGRLVPTGRKPLKDLFNPGDVASGAIEHLLSMQFLDVRAVRYLEIRMADALPYPYNIALAALWKGLLYNDANLELLYTRACADRTAARTLGEVIDCAADAGSGGRRLVAGLLGELMMMAAGGLEAGERRFLRPLEIFAAARPKDLTLELLGKGKAAALQWCNANQIIGGV